MYRDLPSGIRRLSRPLTSILVQGTEFKVSTSTSSKTNKSSSIKIKVGIASCTNARNTYVGEAWCVGNASSTAGQVQLGILDSRENRAFESLNSPELAQLRNWNQLNLKSFEQNNSFLFSGYTKGRGAYTAVTPASIVASKLASQFLTSSSSSGKQKHPPRSHHSAASMLGGTSIPESLLRDASPSSSPIFNSAVIDGTQGADASFSSFAADFSLREELVRAAKQQKRKQLVEQQEDNNRGNAAPSSVRSSSSSSPMQTGCRGVWANINALVPTESVSSSSPLIKLEVHSLGNARGVLISNKQKPAGVASINTDKYEGGPSPSLKRIREKAQELPTGFEAEKKKQKDVDYLGIPITTKETTSQFKKKEGFENEAFDAAIVAKEKDDDDKSKASFSAMHPKLLSRRLRMDPLTNDHRPIRPEEARRIGKAALAEESDEKRRNDGRSSSPTSTIRSSRGSTVGANNASTVQDAAGGGAISPDVITEDEFIRGDFAVDVSRAFGHFHFKNCQALSPDEQMLTCRPETVTRYLNPGDVVVLGNNPLFSPSTPNSARFMGGWGVTLDSIAAHVIQEFEDNNNNDNRVTVHDVARDIIQLSLLSGAEHNVSVVVLRVVEEEEEKEEVKMNIQNNNFVEYAIPGEVHPYLLHQSSSPNHDGLYSQSLRRDIWRLGFDNVSEFAEARGEILAGSFAKFQSTLKKHAGTTDRPSPESPLDLWQGGLAPEICTPMMLTGYPSTVSNMIREMQAEMDWCEKEARKK